MVPVSQSPALRAKMGEAAQQKVRNMGGWDTYGLAFKDMIGALQ